MAASTGGGGGGGAAPRPVHSLSTLCRQRSAATSSGHSGGAASASSKLMLELVPRTPAALATLEKDGHVPHQALTFRATKGMRSILSHLASKWAQSAVTLRAHPNTCTPLLRGMCWTIDVDADLKLTYEFEDGPKAAAAAISTQPPQTPSRGAPAQEARKVANTGATGPTPQEDVSDKSAAASDLGREPLIPKKVTQNTTNASSGKAAAPAAAAGKAATGKAKGSSRAKTPKAAAAKPRRSTKTKASPAAAAPCASAASSPRRPNKANCRSEIAKAPAELLDTEPLAGAGNNTCDEFAAFLDRCEEDSRLPPVAGSTEAAAGATPAADNHRDHPAGSRQQPPPTSLFRQELTRVLSASTGKSDLAGGGDSQDSSEHMDTGRSLSLAAQPGTSGRVDSERPQAQETSLGAWQDAFGSLPGLPELCYQQAAALPSGKTQLPVLGPFSQLMASNDSNMLAEILGMKRAASLAAGAEPQAPSNPATPRGCITLGQGLAASPLGLGCESLGFSIGIDSLLGVQEATPKAEDMCKAMETLPGRMASPLPKNKRRRITEGAPAGDSRAFQALFQK